jgi:inorganic pyrophosphatase
MSADLTKLPAYDDAGALRVVVESPRQSPLKLKYEPALRMFTVLRELPLGVVYPFDWGFIPGTLGDDGDPIDAMAIHRTPTYPGVLLPCRVLGMVEVVQRDDKHPPEVNNRVIATPDWHSPLEKIAEARDLPANARAEIERFFVTVAALTGKRLKINGWATRRRTDRFLRQHLA